MSSSQILSNQQRHDGGADLRNFTDELVHHQIFGTGMRQWSQGRWMTVILEIHESTSKGESVDQLGIQENRI